MLAAPFAMLLLSATLMPPLLIRVIDFFSAIIDAAQRARAVRGS